MTDEKVKINIVYSPQDGPPSKIYENDKAEIWNSKTRDPNRLNVGMGWYSIRDPNPEDSILVVEPYCVLDRDYELGFVKKFKHIFTWATNAFKHPSITNKVVHINHPTYHHPPSPNISETWSGWGQRNNEIIFVANNKSSKHHSELYSFRLILADILNVNSSFKVSWYGQMPIKRNYYRGRLDDKMATLRKTKFSVCTENSYDPSYTHNYFTEKMPDVWKAGSVPIYFGCHNIDEFGFFDGSYIDLRKYSRKDKNRWIIDKPRLIQKIEQFSEQDYNSYIQRLDNEIFKSGKFEKHTSYTNVYEKIIATLTK
jgi:hypothetical protein